MILGSELELDPSSPGAWHKRFSHMEFLMGLYKYQSMTGSYSVHEQQYGTTLWESGLIQEFLITQPVGIASKVMEEPMGKIFGDPTYAPSSNKWCWVTNSTGVLRTLQTGGGGLSRREQLHLRGIPSQVR